MLDLREYQRDLIDSVRGALRRSKRVLVQLPTGGGKTVISAFMAGTSASKGLHVNFACHRDFLIDQSSRTFEQAGIDHTFVAAGRNYHPFKPVIISSIDTLRRRLDKIAPPNVLMIDEAHHAVSSSWSRVVDWADGSFIIGLSATPARLDGRGLGKHFDEIVQGPSVRALIDAGHLSDYKVYCSPMKVNLGGVGVVAGDYNKAQLNAIMDKSTLVGDMVSNYQKHANGMRALYYAVSIEASKHIAAQFQAAGIGAAHMDGDTPSEERRDTAKRMARGEISVITNCAIATEGYDLSAQAGMDVPIECIGIARPTMSLALHLQMLGRGLRAKPHPAIIIDHAGNCMKHGLPDDPREWTLDGITKKAKNAADPVRQCPECFRIHPPAPICPGCGYFYEKQPRKVVQINGELVEFDAKSFHDQRVGNFRSYLFQGMSPMDAAKRMAREMGESPRDLEALLHVAKRTGKQPMWAAHVYIARLTKKIAKQTRSANTE